MFQSNKYDLPKEHLRIEAGAAKPFKNFSVENYRTDKNGRAVADSDVVSTALSRAAKLGVLVNPSVLETNLAAYNQRMTMDAIQNPVSTPSIVTPIQFLQYFMPGQVEIVTAARKIDDVLGLSIMGNFADEQMVQRYVERVGSVLPYGDYSNIPLANYNVNYEYRTVVRFFLGMSVDILEEMRAAAASVSVSNEKRAAIANALEIQRNLIGFYGYNNGANFTYGFLTEPTLPAYVPVPNGVSGQPSWLFKTTNEVINDILLSGAALRTNSQDTIDPQNDPLRLILPTNRIDLLNQPTQYGYDVKEWIRRYNPNITIVSAPQLNSANGGANVFYLFPETVNDGSTDDRRVFVQMVQARAMMLKVKQDVTHFTEGTASATAGVICKRSWAIVRYTGI